MNTKSFVAELKKMVTQKESTQELLKCAVAEALGTGILVFLGTRKSCFSFYDHNFIYF